MTLEIGLSWPVSVLAKHFTAKEPMRYRFDCVLVHPRKGKWRAVATDSRTLGCVDLDASSDGEEFEDILIPPRALQAFSDIGERGRIFLRQQGKAIRLRGEKTAWELTLPRIEDGVFAPLDAIDSVLNEPPAKAMPCRITFGYAFCQSALRAYEAVERQVGAPEFRLRIFEADERALFSFGSQPDEGIYGAVMPVFEK